MGDIKVKAQFAFFYLKSSLGMAVEIASGVEVHSQKQAVRTVKYGFSKHYEYIARA